MAGRTLGERSEILRSSEIRARAESPEDVAAVRQVLARAFASDAEAKLVDALRGRTEPQISLVAEHGSDAVIGHVLFSPVAIRSSSGTTKALGLAPLAVLPDFQRQGVGAMLVEAGLSACRAAGEPLVVVLGHASYYPRFGFRPAWDSGLYYASPGPNPAFMVCELEPGALRGRAGEVRYHAAFDGL